jgi:hypothetical protein
VAIIRGMELDECYYFRQIREPCVELIEETRAVGRVKRRAFIRVLR